MKQKEYSNQTRCGQDGLVCRNKEEAHLAPLFINGVMRLSWVIFPLQTRRLARLKIFVIQP